MDKSFLMVFLKKNYIDPTGRQNFGDAPGQIPKLILTLCHRYYHWVIAYVLGAGIVSFAVIYRLGPPSNPRTLNLIQWAMQLAGLATIVLSSYYQVTRQRPMLGS